MNSPLTVDTLAHEIRDFINQRRIQYVLLQDRRRWFQLCTCLDVIEDCELAIAAYASPSAPRGPDPDKGETYLVLFGLLQAFFVQQDAVENLAESLGMTSSLERQPGLTRVRDVRNMTSGHPTKRGRGEAVSFHAINRSSLSMAAFELVTASKDGTQGFQTYSVLDLIADQRHGIRAALAVILERIRERDRLHREQFRHEKLEEILDGHVGYSLEKLGEGLSPLSPSGGPLARMSVDELAKALDDFQGALERRELSLDTYEAVRDVVWRIRYALIQLARYFEGLPDSDITTIQIAEMVIAYVRHGIRGLREMAAEIDADYQS